MMSCHNPLVFLLFSLGLGCSQAQVKSVSHVGGRDPNHVDPNAPTATALCPAGTSGIAVGPDKRFFFGMNYAWQDFGADFGGISAWGQTGVASHSAEHANNLAKMRKSGAAVVRWWMLPDFRGDGVLFDDQGKPMGLGGSFTDDLEEALRIAEENDVYLMLTLFSFDAFFPTEQVGGQTIHGIAPILRVGPSRTLLVNNVVRPIAKIVQASTYAHRVLAWDVINEPEWAMTGSNPLGDPQYTPMQGIDPVTHGEMETFVREVTAALHEETHAYVTVGSAAVKWAHAWKCAGIDFYQPHVYDWIDARWPYDNPPSKYDLADKPVVIGEFPTQGLPGATLGTMLEKFYQVGYAGAIPWDFHSAKPEDFTTMASFAVKHQCGGITDPNLPPSGNCADVPPDNMYTCEQQAAWGKCNEPWMQGFCLKSCGKCP